VRETALAFYREPAAMSAVPGSIPGVSELPGDVDGLRGVVQGLLLHRDLIAFYGVTGEGVRLDEQHLREVAAVLGRALELRPEAITQAREPVDRVQGICRHYALLHTAFLRVQGTPARVRCGFGGYFEPGKWTDHWITEWWDGGRWVRHDPQIDDGQREAFGIDFDPYDQPAGQFLSGAEAWHASRAGEVDATRFGIFDMWGPAFIAGNVLLDVACLNKVGLLPWDHWAKSPDLDPHAPVPDDVVPFIDEVAELVLDDDHVALRERYLRDARLTVPPDITTYIDGQAAPAHLAR
jgi:Transglutaminase-like superfamily